MVLTDNDRVYLAVDEKVPQHVTRHKSHVLKVMFLCAVGRPWKTRRQQSECNDGKLISDDRDDWYWDGKLGCYPIVDTRLTQRRSVNREAGVPEPYLVAMTAAVYEKFLLEKLLPDIAAKCPFHMRKEPIWIQHDNAPPHRVNQNVSE
jgi:hypothetical protein